jgi:hypothetical protein
MIAISSPASVWPQPTISVAPRAGTPFAAAPPGSLPLSLPRAGRSGNFSNPPKARPGSITRSALLARLASSHDALVARPGLPRLFARPLSRGARRGLLRQSEQTESIRNHMIAAALFVAINVQELRRLIAHLLAHSPVDASLHWHWSFLGASSPSRSKTRPLSKTP